MASSQPLSPVARLALGALCIAGGILPILAAFDVAPFHQRDIHGPPWLAGVAGGIFVVAGIAMFMGDSGCKGWLSQVLSFCLLGAFAAIGNWIAFGPGPRECSGGFTAFWFSSRHAAAEFECRAAFGIGALAMNGTLIYLLAQLPKKLLGETTATEWIEKLGGGALLASLLPLLLPLLVFGIVSAIIAGLCEYWKTGKWPRNEEFIARMKKRKEERERGISSGG